MLAEQSPASFVAWDLLALGDEDLRDAPQGERRARLEQALGDARRRRSTSRRRRRDRALAARLVRPLRGRRARRRDGEAPRRPYQPGKRAMIKVKHERTADCVVAGFRWHKNGPGHARRLAAARAVRRRAARCTRRRDVVVHLGQARGARSRSSRRCARTRSRATRGASGPSGREAAEASGQRLPGATSRWNRGKDLSWEPLRARARRRGRLRPPAGRPLPPRHDLRALAPRQAARATAATTSSRRRRPTSWSGSSAAADSMARREEST